MDQTCNTRHIKNAAQIGVFAAGLDALATLGQGVSWLSRYVSVQGPVGQTAILGAAIYAVYKLADKYLFATAEKWMKQGLDKWAPETLKADGSARVWAEKNLSCTHKVVKIALVAAMVAGAVVYGAPHVPYLSKCICSSINVQQVVAAVLGNVVAL